MNITILQDQLRDALPPEHHEAIQVLAGILVGMSDRIMRYEDAQKQLIQFTALLQSLTGKEFTAGKSQISFGENNTFGNITIRDIVGRDSIIINLHPSLTPAPGLHQLPSPIEDFVGRQREVKELVMALQNRGTNGAVVAIRGISGMGGIGKTELASVVAQELKDTFFDCQLFIELRGVRENPLSPIQALQQILHAFEPESKLPDSLAELTGLYRSRLANKRVLILADDAGYEDQILPLVPPLGCALLITSRRRLRGIKAITLGTLPPKQAKELLLKISSRIGKHAARLAQLCDYLPLALHISAGLLATDPSIDVGQYLKQLEEERIKYLSYPENPNDPRASVEASLQLSYVSLDTSIQDTFCQLSVFPTSFDLAAAKKIIITKEVPEKVLGQLLRVSLLEWNDAAKRYDLHDLIRAFGAARLKDPDSIKLRHAQHYIKVASHAQDDLYMNGETLAGLRLFDQERTHIDSGWDWAKKQSASASIDGDLLLLGYAKVTDFLGELRYNPRNEYLPRFKLALEAARRTEKPDEECCILANLGDCCGDLGDPIQAIEFYEQALAIARKIGDLTIENWGLGGLGWAYMMLGKGHQSITFCEEAIIIARAVDDKNAECSYLNTLGRAYATLNDQRHAIEYSQQCIALARTIHDPYWEGYALGNLAREYVKVGEPDRAIELANQALLIRHKLGDKWGESEDLSNLGLAYASLGDLSRAVELFDRAIVIAHQIGDESNLARYHRDLGGVLVQQGNLERAVEVTQLYVNYWRKINHENIEQAVILLAQLRQQRVGQK